MRQTDDNICANCGGSGHERSGVEYMGMYEMIGCDWCCGTGFKDIYLGVERLRAEITELKTRGILSAMDFDFWLDYGVTNGFCSPQVCATHAGIPSVNDEDMSEDQDFCVHVVRLGTEDDWQADIDAFREMGT